MRYVLIVVTAFCLVGVVAAVLGRLMGAKCPNCGKRKTYAATGQSRREQGESRMRDPGLGGYRRLENGNVVYHEFKCENCGHTEWKQYTVSIGR